jgi:cytochrome b involved in lipid metabolism
VKYFTAAEVAKHNTRGDCWMIISGKVYDVTDEVEDHVGADAILKNAGKDNTKGFHGEQHPSRAHDTLVGSALLL